MKTLVIYYSRSGTTKKVAEQIAKELGADIEGIIDQTNRKGIIGWIFGGRDAMKKFITVISPTKKDASSYDQIIMGTPIWAGNISPAVRTYLQQNKSKLKQMAFFCTKGGTAIPNAIKSIEELTGTKSFPILEISTAETKNNSFIEKVQKFAASLK